MEAFEIVCQEVDAGRPVALVTVIGCQGEQRVGSKVVVGVAGVLWADLQEPALLGAMRTLGEEVLASGEPMARNLELPPGRVRVYAEPYLPLPELVIVGAGHVGQALADMADPAGFAVTVIDDRPGYARADRFPRARRVIAGDFEETLHGLGLGSRHYVVLVTRGHLHDLTALRAVLRYPVAYVGMIGSQRRVKTVFELLAGEGVDRTLLDRVYAPIGLDIGANTPAEIAVAILAEIIRVRRGGTGEHLSRLGRALVHDPRTRR